MLLRAVQLGFGLALTLAVMATQPAENDAPDDRAIVIASLNVARENRASVIAQGIREQEVLRGASIVLLQEVPDGAKGRPVADEVAERLGYHVASANSDRASPDQGLAILSRFPLEETRVTPLKRFDQKFHSRIRFALSASARTQQGPVRIWNVHLDSRINPSERVTQLKPVLDDAKAWTGRALLGGDFNTTRFQWLMNVVPARMGSSQVKTVRSAVEAHGFRSPMPDDMVTYPFLHQHLDWIFARGAEAESSGAVFVPFSDHFAVWASYTLVH